MSIPEIVSIEEFIEWMIAEPQTIVWLPTLHRLAVSETGSHFLFVCLYFILSLQFTHKHILRYNSMPAQMLISLSVQSHTNFRMYMC